MKNILIVNNIIVLLVGNLLFSNIHYIFHSHLSHNHNEENNECIECITIENNNNCVENFDEVYFSNNTINLFVYQQLNFIKFNVKQTYFSRAPPKSQIIV